MIQRLHHLLNEAITNPRKIQSYLFHKIGSNVNKLKERAVLTAAWLWAKKNHYKLNSQLKLLNDFRSQDEYLLIILDACRYDAFTDHFEEFLEADVQPVVSEGYDTFQWGRLCWNRDQVDAEKHDVTYVSGATPINGYSELFEAEYMQNLYQGWVPKENIGTIVDAWEAGWDETLGTVPPEAVRRIAKSYLHEPRLVVHFFQPHAPYIGDEQELGHVNSQNALPGQGEPETKPIWEKVESGAITKSRLRELYKSNIMRVLPEVAALINEAPHEKVAIVGDHGEALGELGMFAHKRREHPFGRVVPWAEVQKINNEKVKKSLSAKKPNKKTHEVKDRLRDLGYLQ